MSFTNVFSFFSLYSSLADAGTNTRQLEMFIDPDPTMEANYPFSKWVRLIPCRQTVRRAGEPSSDPSGSNRGSDHTSVTVDDVSSVLDRSGRRMTVLVSAPED